MIFDIENVELKQALLEQTFNYTYYNLLRGNINDPEITEVIFKYFIQNPTPRFFLHHQEINEEEIRERDRFLAEEEEVQGVLISPPISLPSYSPPPQYYEYEEQSEYERAEESWEEFSESEEDTSEIFISFQQLREYREQNYSYYESDSEYESEPFYDTDDSLPYSANLDSD